MEVRQIPVLCEDTPNILQPGWSAQYREEREKLLQESLLEERRSRGRGSAVVMEMEMQDMASIGQGEIMSEQSLAV